MKRIYLIKRLRALRNWEAIDIGLFIALYARWVLLSRPQTWLLTAFSVFLVSYMLLQGSIYWHMKVKSLVTKQSSLPDYFRLLFTWLRISSIVLLGLFPVVAIVCWQMKLTTVLELCVASVITIFALLEYTNYYCYQLMHDSKNDLRYLQQHKRLRKAPLATDLMRAQSRR